MDANCSCHNLKRISLTSRWLWGNWRFSGGHKSFLLEIPIIRLLDIIGASIREFGSSSSWRRWRSTCRSHTTCSGSEDSHSFPNLIHSGVHQLDEGVGSGWLECGVSRVWARAPADKLFMNSLGTTASKQTFSIWLQMLGIHTTLQWKSAASGWTSKSLQLISHGRIVAI